MQDEGQTETGVAGEGRFRLGVGIALGVVVMVAAGLAFEPRLSELGAPSFVERYNVLRAAGAVGFGLSGAFVVAIRPTNRVGWLLSAVGVALSVSLLASNYGLAGIHDPAGSLPGERWAMWVSEWMWAPAHSVVATLLLLVFPTGQLPSARWRPVAVAAVLTAVLNTIGWASLPPADVVGGSDVEGLYPPGYRPPVPSSLVVAEFALSTALLLGVLTMLASLGSLAQRYRRAAGVEREQLKWVLVGALALVALAVGAFFAPVPVGPLVAGIAMVPLPAAMAVAVVYHRLWDIDVVLSRSLVFGTLTAAVVAVYGVTVAVVGRLLGATTGAPLVATALVAVGIHPAHRRVRRLVNRLVYGDRDDPSAALRHLGTRLGESGHFGEVLADVARDIGERLRVPYVAIEVGGLLASEWGKPVPAVERVPLNHRSVEVGALVVGTAAGDRLRPAHRRALHELAPHVAVVAHARRLAGDLERSYGRLIAARDDERQRLRRELHDGLGPTLAALALEVDRGRLLVGRDPESAARLLDRLASRIRDAVGGVRAIVDDLHPPPLDELGLLGAVEDLAGRFAGELAISVEAETLPPLNAAVELAAYRIAAEAISNAVRHAAASSCTVTLAAAGNELELRVSDDGRGLAGDATEGVGLPSMRERAADLGGSCSVGCRSGGGTEVVARLPLKGLRRDDG